MYLLGLVRMYPLRPRKQAYVLLFSHAPSYHRVPAAPHACSLPGRANSMAYRYLPQSHPFRSKVHPSRDPNLNPAHRLVEF